MNVEGLWDGFVPGWLVHRTQLSEVLITDVRPDGTLRFIGGAQWPRRHPYFGPIDDAPVRVDVAITAETLQQATIAVFHRWLDAPRGHAFVMEELRVRVFEAVRSVASPSNVRVTVELSDHVERRGVTTEAKSTVRMFLDGQMVAHGRGDAHFATGGRPTAPCWRRDVIGEPSAGSTMGSLRRRIG